ncbi:MAG: adaptor protein MecA [Roseburia sp.]|nr:adaptor protein MecA [Ruminococcus sp.]MCM1156633.1 adaptor protein MecA [Roseburia sp.]MCM1242488.1 adaptor protein MecA [Roseburia sp.]
MKIEKVNEHQIRCTLTREDLVDRELKISELAYGTEKAKTLFRDMMQQAAYECGFEAEDIPLMIEAIPLNAECIVLIVTKVEDPEELDTRFSKFAPSVHDDDMDDDHEDLMEAFADSADEMLDMLRKMDEQSRSFDTADTEVPRTATTRRAPVIPHTNRMFSFPTLDDVMRLCHIAAPFYIGVSSLYKNDSDGSYLLLISPARLSVANFNRLCNICSEYGCAEHFSSAVESYLEEHCEPIIKDKAIQSLASI